MLFLTCAPVFSAGEVEFSGLYRVRTYALGNYWNSGGNRGDDLNSLSEQYFVSRLRLNFVFRPTDQIEVRWRFHAPHHTRWGASGEGLATRSMYYYGIAKTDFGRFSIGRQDLDLNAAGLQTLGYMPTWGLASQGFIFDVDSEDDGIRYDYKWDNWGLKAFYIKEKSDDSGFGSDQDYDRFSVEPYYAWDNGGLALAVQYDRDMAAKNSKGGFYDTNYYFSLNPAFMHQWNVGEGKSLSVHLEGKYSKGRRQTEPGASKYGIDGAGIYADLNYNYGPGDLTLGGWWFDGGLDDKHNLVHPGEGFYPFLIFYGLAQARGAKGLEGFMEGNHWGGALLGSHSLTSEVKAFYGVGHFTKNKTLEGVSKNMGTEIDLGLNIQLLDNMRFSTKAAYFMPGDYYKERYDRRDYDKNIMAWMNELMIFF